MTMYIPRDPPSSSICNQLSGLWKADLKLRFLTVAWNFGEIWSPDPLTHFSAAAAPPTAAAAPVAHGPAGLSNQ